MVVNVKAEYAKQQAAKAAAAKSTVAKTIAAKPDSSLSNFTYGSGNPQSGIPASFLSPVKPTVTKKSSGDSKPKSVVKDTSSERLQAQAEAYFINNPDIDPTTGQKKITVPGGGSTPGKKVLRTIQNADGTTTIVYDDGSIETTGTPNTVKKPVEKIPNIAYDTVQKILESYRITGLASVLESIRDEYPEANSEELITLLQFDSRYNTKFNERFAGNVTRMKAGKPVYSPGEYLKLEQGFDKVLTSYNQPAFKIQSYYDKWIVGDVDAVEVAERVQLGYDRVLSDDPVNRAFTKFYSALGYSDIVAGMLDPVNQLPALQQKVKAAEIGGAALRQGFKADEISLTATGSTLGADILAKQGVTKAEAEKAYSNIAGLLPTAEKLSSIYGSTEAKYGKLEAEEEQFQGLASAERKRKRLSGLETAQFQSDSGMATQSLKQISAGQY